MIKFFDTLPVFVFDHIIVQSGLKK